jgi:type II secretory pathway pseudopilin PulG
MKNNKNKKAFTLIELMVVITIMIIMVMAVHTPYQVYKNKQKVRNSTKIITQALYESRAKAIY